MPDAWPLRLSPILLVVFCADAGASGARENLAAGFDRPPEDTRPACYWYRMSDHISEADLTKDSEAMARVGIGEAFIGNVEQGGTREREAPDRSVARHDAPGLPHGRQRRHV